MPVTGRRSPAARCVDRRQDDGIADSGVVPPRGSDTHRDPGCSRAGGTMVDSRTSKDERRGNGARQASRNAYSQGKSREAIPMAEHSLALREKALGPAHPLVALSLNNLALLL